MQVRNNTGRQNKGTSKDTIASDAEDSLEYSLYSKEAGLPFPQQNTYEQRHGSPKNLSGIKKVNYRFLAEQQPDMQPDSVSSHLKKLQTLEVNRMSSSVPLRESPPEDLLDHDGEFCEETASPSIPMIREDGGNEASETSAVEYISATDMSPDDVVGIIGLKHFWKARTAIVKQQKAFAVQVFELHRLMKVQKLISESPHLLLDGIAHIAKSVVSSVKKLPLEYIVEAPSNILNHRNDFEKIPRKRERSAENAEKASLHPPEYKQFPPNAGEPHIDLWSSYPSQAHQWLIPVMSPTEGLVYKPYSGHGFPTPVHGGPENFHPSGYGLLASHQQFPGMGVPSAGNHGFFPSYSMPVVNAVGNNHAMDHTNHFALQGLQHQLSGGGAANFNVQRQESFHLPIQNSGANHGVLKSKKPTASEVQSTGLDNIIELSNPLAPLCSSPVTDISSCRSNGDKGDQQARVIRVVPHNRKSATESVARIFHSIQEERKQFDFV